MAKLYIFGIGGTGSRIIKALTMLLASGVKLKNGFDTVVPIIIDPDAANGDMTRTTDILLKYQNIYNAVEEPENFFGTRILTLPQLAGKNTPNITNNFRFDVAGSGKKFGESIDYNGLDDANKALMDLLFSEENINADMTVGFKGNPNIGSIVLNNIVSSKEYKTFTESFNQGDAVFIINSIFGGTGASGFPLLLKNLRTNKPEIVNSNIISNSVIGALTLFPYFKISDPQDGKKTIDSSTFLGKTKAALSYYEHAIFKNNSLNAFYYLGDNSNNNMPYAEGKIQQKNDAHFLEMAGAMAIVDFTGLVPNIDDPSLMKPREFGVITNNNPLKFNDLGSNTRNELLKPLAKMYFFKLFLSESLNILNKNKGTFNHETVKPEFYDSNFYKNEFFRFLEYFDEWITEMRNNDVSFTPFDTNVEHDNILEFIEGIKPPKSKFGAMFSNKSSGNRIIDSLHSIAKSGKYNTKEVEYRFIRSFDEVLEDAIEKLKTVN